MKIELNKVYNENCLLTMSNLPDNFIHLVVTSPPYDNLRDYRTYKFEFKKIAKELYRILKKGGVIVWVVGDQTVEGSETGTSFKQVLYFKKIGFKLHDTMFYCKESSSHPSSNRYNQAVEYMFVLSKGIPSTTNIIKDRKNKGSFRTIHGTDRQKDGSTKSKYNTGKLIKENSARLNYWIMSNPYIKKDIRFRHPATFPTVLARDHIITWTNENDIVYDPMSGAGTTIIEAYKLKRRFLGSEMSREYCEITAEIFNDNKLIKSKKRLELSKMNFPIYTNKGFKL